LNLPQIATGLEAECKKPLRQKGQSKKKLEDVDVIRNCYVYLHKEPKTGTPFYVGRGKGRRAYDRTRRHQDWNEFVEAIGGQFDVEIVKRNLSEGESYRIEADLIAQYGKKRDNTGSLVNWTAGGENELGNLTISIDFPEYSKRRLREYQNKIYDATPYRVLLGEERRDFVERFSDIVEELWLDLNGIWGKEDEYTSLWGSLTNLECDIDDYSRRAISSQDMAFYIDEEIRSIKSDLEDAVRLRKELRAHIRRTIKELTEIRKDLAPI
jgi:hypothetical protein